MEVPFETSAVLITCVVVTVEYALVKVPAALVTLEGVLAKVAAALVTVVAVLVKVAAALVTLEVAIHAPVLAGTETAKVDVGKVALLGSACSTIMSV
eukprot:CAMPEP_0180668928 /NCGR_PEP_ID=MMETSP1037_2-20121125/63202_1 /TAXON_ID=632150 /ORGANISM="Azadinium spinosum, Strain 3D9" /LENGTH=96 /DNA_ID=CAMNT_0022697721 /DNA_START=170 /DNA_END=460 /DNA_ORIENTATION=+